jgi:hypothetical protein
MEPFVAGRTNGWTWSGTSACCYRTMTSTPSVKVILGKFKMKHVRCRVAACTYGGVKFLLDDAYQNAGADPQPTLFHRHRLEPLEEYRLVDTPETGQDHVLQDYVLVE